MTNDKDKGNSPPAFDIEQAKNMLGKCVLIGLTCYNSNGKFVEQYQMHGKIICVDKKGISIALEGSRYGEIYTLPPDLRSFREAPPGEYRERSTGEIVINPDFTATWIVNQGPPHKD